MNNNFILVRIKLFLLIMAMVLPYSSAYSSNGLKLIASGTRAKSMGGADVANSADTSVLNVNPGVITKFTSPRVDVHFGNAFLFNLRHSDRFDSKKVSNKTAQLLDISYVSKFDNYPLYWGTGLFATGGLGVEYENINTPFNTQDDLTSLIGFLSFTPSIAYKFSENLSIGASLVATYIDAEQKFFPDTSAVDQQNPARSFFGTEFKNADDFGYGFRTGIQYKPNQRLTLGAAYTSKVELSPEGDNFQINMNAIGLGKVNYNRLRLAGVDFPQEISLGLEYQVNPELTVAADISWLNWSDAVKRSTLSATNPDNPLAPAQITNTADLRWKNQYVFALGMAYQLTPQIELRGGYNYGRAPVRAETLSPLFSPHAERHLSIGLGKKFGSKWSADVVALYIFNSKIRYTNPNLPFGPDAEEEGETAQLEFTLSYEF